MAGPFAAVGAVGARVGAAVGARVAAATGGRIAASTATRVGAQVGSKVATGTATKVATSAARSVSHGDTSRPAAQGPAGGPGQQVSQPQMSLLGPPDPATEAIGELVSGVVMEGMSTGLNVAHNPSLEHRWDR